MRFLNLIDEYTRECRAIHIGRRINSSQLIDVLAEAMIEHGIPEYIRSDNGPEFVAKQLRKWLARIGAKTSVHRTRLSLGERGKANNASHFPTPPTAISRCATLTISLVQITGQATRACQRNWQQHSRRP